MFLKFMTNGFNAYNIQYCPQSGHRFGCVASKNFGIAGSGALFVADICETNFGPQVQCHRVYHWSNDPLYDLCWSEELPNIVWTVSANGFIQIWDFNLSDMAPIHVVRGHDHEIYSANWSLMTPESPQVLTTCADSYVKIWDAITSNTTQTFQSHGNIVYSGQWSPFIPQTFATTSGDSTLRIWSMKQTMPTLTIKASFGEVLSCDWNKFNQFVITTSDTNGLINVWDIRAPINPLVTLSGHQKAVKCVKFSPMRESVIGSVSYDLTTRLWDMNSTDGLLFTSQQHKEFVYGFDFNRNIIDQMADCSWDQFVHIFHYSPQFVTKNRL